MTTMTTVAVTIKTIAKMLKAMIEKLMISDDDNNDDDGNDDNDNDDNKVNARSSATASFNYNKRNLHDVPLNWQLWFV